MKKNQWMDKIFNGIKEISPAEPDPVLFTRILQKLNDQAEVSIITRLNFSMALIGFILLFLINLFVVFSDLDRNYTTQQNQNPINIFTNHLYQNE